MSGQSQVGGVPQGITQGIERTINKGEDIYAGHPYTGYGGEMVAPINTDQQTSYDLARNIALGDIGEEPLNSAAARAGMISNTPMGLSGLGSLTASAPPSFTGARIDTGAVPQVSAGTGLSGMGAYANPYENQVVQSTLDDIDRQRRQAINGNSSSATLQGGEGAWNGARAGVSDALTNDAALRATASAAGSLRSQGFTTAAGLSQQDQDRALQAGTANQSALTGVLGQNAGYAQQAGLADAGFAQDTANANANRALAAGQADQGAGLQGFQNELQRDQLLATLGAQQRANANADVDLLRGAGDAQTQQRQALDTARQQDAAKVFDDPYKRLAAVASTYGASIPGYAATSGGSGPLGAVGSGLNAVGQIASMGGKP